MENKVDAPPPYSAATAPINWEHQQPHLQNPSFCVQDPSTGNTPHSYYPTGGVGPIQSYPPTPLNGTTNHISSSFVYQQPTTSQRYQDFRWGTTKRRRGATTFLGILFVIVIIVFLIVSFRKIHNTP